MIRSCLMDFTIEMLTIQNVFGMEGARSLPRVFQYPDG
jgi:hypothetical protein